MSKKLEALETLKLLKDFVLENNKNGLDRRFIIGSCDILEQELKEYEDLKEEYKSLLELSKQTTKECIYLLKYSRAIKIMKDKQVEIAWFRVCHSFKDYNDSVSKRRALTPEEYELLAEVLA